MRNRATPIFISLSLLLAGGPAATCAAPKPTPLPPPPAGGVTAAADQAAAAAQALLDQGKTQEAVNAYVALIKQYPNSGALSASLFRLGYAEYLLGNYKDAVLTLRRIQTPPAAPEVKAAADAMIPQIISTQASKLPEKDPARAAGFADAIKQFDAFIQKYPNSPQIEAAEYGRALAAYQNKQLDEAIKSLQVNLRHATASPAVMDSKSLMAAILTQQGTQMLREHGDQRAAMEKLNEALRLLAEIINQHSDVALSNSAQFQIGEVLFNRASVEDPSRQPKDLENAMAAYRAVQPKEAMIEAQKQRIATIVQRRQQAVLGHSPPALIQQLESLQESETAKAEALKDAPDQTLNAQLRIAASFVLLQRFDEARVLLRYLEPFADEAQKKQILYYETLTYASQGITDKAVQAYEEFKGKYKGDPLGENLPISVGSAFLQKGKPDEAIKYFNEEVALYPKSPLVGQVLARQAAALMNLHKFDDALKTYQKYLATNPPKEMAAQAEEGLATVYQQTNKIQDAIKQYRKVRDTYPGTPEAEQSAYYAARLLVSTGNLKDGLKELEDFVSRFPNGKYSAEALMTVGQVQAAAGDKDDAIKTFKQVIAKYPDDPQSESAYFQEAVTLGAEKKTDEMLAVMKDFIAAKPDSKNIYYAYDTIGQTQASKGQIPQAVQTYQEMVDKHPDNEMAANALYHVADLWKKSAASLGNYLALSADQRKEWMSAMDKSLAAGETFMGKYAQSKQAGLALKVLLDDQEMMLAAQIKTPDEVQKYFTQLAAKVGSDKSAKSQVLFTQAAFTYERDKAKALQQMQAAYDPGLVYAPSDLDLYASALIDGGKADAAYKIYEKIAKDYPIPPNAKPAQAPPAIQEAQATALYGMAHALEKQNKTAEAGKLYTELKATYPWSPKVVEANFGIARSLIAAGKFDDAMKLLVSVVGSKNAPTDLRAQGFDLIGDIYAGKGDITGAINNYMKVAMFYAGAKEAAAEGLWKGGQALEKQAAGLTEQSSPKKSAQVAQAVSAYQDLLNKYPNSQYVPKARERLAAMGK